MSSQHQHVVRSHGAPGAVAELSQLPGTPLRVTRRHEMVGRSLLVLTAVSLGLHLLVGGIAALLSGSRRAEAPLPLDVGVMLEVTPRREAVAVADPLPDPRNPAEPPGAMMAPDETAPPEVSEIGPRGAPGSTAPEMETDVPAAAAQLVAPSATVPDPPPIPQLSPPMSSEPAVRPAEPVAGRPAGTARPQTRLQPSAPLPRRGGPPASEPQRDRAHPVPIASAGPIVASPMPAQTAPLPLQSATAAAEVPSGAWRSALAVWVQSRKRYPDAARRQGESGTVRLRFTVGRDGAVLDAQVVQSSGSEALDQATVAMFRGARAPSFPAEMAMPQVSIVVGIKYRLDE